MRARSWTARGPLHDRIPASPRRRPPARPPPRPHAHRLRRRPRRPDLCDDDDEHHHRRRVDHGCIFIDRHVERGRVHHRRRHRHRRRRDHELDRHGHRRTTDTSAPTTCPCFAGDGPYCGQSVADHAGEAGCEVPSLAGHEGDLLACAAGEWTVQEACAEGCLSTTPGESDACQLPLCACFVKVAWCGSGAAEHGQGLDPPCRVPLVPEHNGDILGCEGPDWIVKQKCPKGCHENQMGVPDTCNDDSLYLLPYACGDAFTCSQGNFGSSHQGSQAYAWDFAMPKGTPVHAARAGVVAYAEVRSPPGSPCYDPPGLLESCHNKANFVGVRHADGTVALYMHLRQLAVGEGDVVAQGDVIGLSGNSGYTSGPHLHFQLQNDCGIWFCQSVPVSFADAPALAKGKSATSGNCP